ncbi:hypothetical protein D3C71_1364220 [compost metagenome]
MSFEQRTPVHNRAGELVDHATNTCRDLAGRRSLCSRNNGSLQLVADLLLVLFRKLRRAVFIAHNSYGDGLAVAAVVIVIVAAAGTVEVQVLVQRHLDLCGVFLQQSVDLFRRHAVVVLVIVQTALGHVAELFLHQRVIDDVVVRHVPQLVVSRTLTTQMVVNAVKHLVAEKERQFVRRQALDEFAIVIEVFAVRCGRLAPLAGIDQMHSGCKVAEERRIEEQTNTGCGDRLHNGIIDAYHNVSLCTTRMQCQRIYFNRNQSNVK